MRRRATIFLAGLLIVSGLASGGGPRFRFERPVLPGAAGPNRLEPDVPLLAGAATGFVDLRLFDAGGREVPYLLVDPPRREPEWRAGRLLPTAATKTASGFEVDLGTGATVDRVRILGLPAPFLKRFRLEGGGDRSRWTLLVAQGTLFDLPEEKLSRLDVDFPAGDFRYLRLTWDDASSARLPPPGAVTARLVRATDPGRAARVPVAFERRPSEPGKSRFRLRLPAARLPVVALDLDVAGGPGGPLLRAATVAAGRLRQGDGGEIAPARLGETILRRAVRDGLSAADLRIPVSQPEGADLELTVDDGSNPPLELAGVAAELAPLPWIYFEAAGTAPLTARFGDPKAAAPRYDLEALRDQVAHARTAASRWGEVRDLQPREGEAVESPLPALGAPLDTSKFRERRKIPASPPGLTSLLLDAAVLSRSPGLADIRIADAQGRQVPYLLERRDEPMSVPLPTLARRAEKGDPPSLSRYRIDLPYPSLPSARLVLATSARVFDRSVRLVVPVAGRQGREPEERTVAEAAWRHADPETPASQLTLDLPAGTATRYDLVVEEGDNSPLPLAPPRLLLPADRLRFFYPAGASLELLYGQPGLASPRYDLELLAPRLLGETAREIALGPERGRSPEPDAEATGRKIFWGALVGAVVVLLLVLGRMLRRQPEEPAAP
ncbi:MAG: hypothetical protein DMF53_00800 [Acidobacteria bacterium]|nr:MAG: hypothetical protein DMF53_00800 [Acidobacteriota bacterium]